MLFEETPQAISVKALSERTGVGANRLRIEISAINLKLKKLSLSFKGSGDGYYQIVNISD